MLLFAGQELDGLYLFPSDNKLCLGDVVHHFTFFALHFSKPYASLCREADYDYRTLPVGEGLGWRGYLEELQELYAPDHPGPFTIGVWWQDADKKDTSDCH